MDDEEIEAATRRSARVRITGTRKHEYKIPTLAQVGDHLDKLSRASFTVSHDDCPWCNDVVYKVSDLTAELGRWKRVTRSQLTLLEDAEHALLNGRPHVTAEYLSRVIASLRSLGTPPQCIHPGIFPTGPVPGTEHCWTCDRDIPRTEL